MTFKELNIIEPLLKALNEKGYTNPTPIQQQAITPALANRDILGIAQTGTGKTLAFSLPIIQHLHSQKADERVKGIKALILTPTRELAIQINECLNDYTRYTAIRHAVIFGGVKQNAQVAQLRAGVDILVATPGRLIDLINQKIIDLSQIRYFVLDEADRMLDTGFIHDIKRLLPSFLRISKHFSSRYHAQGDSRSVKVHSQEPRKGRSYARIVDSRHRQAISLFCREDREVRIADRSTKERPG